MDNNRQADILQRMELFLSRQEDVNPKKEKSSGAKKAKTIAVGTKVKIIHDNKLQEATIEGPRPNGWYDVKLVLSGMSSCCREQAMLLPEHFLFEERGWRDDKAQKTSTKNEHKERAQVNPMPHNPIDEEEF